MLIRTALATSAVALISTCASNPIIIKPFNHSTSLLQNSSEK